MKKKILFFITLLVATVLFVPNAFAAEGTPEKLVVGAETVLIANGADLTITAPTTSGMGATVTWNGGSIELPADAWVFGGTHNDTSITVNSNITMEGGQLYAIVGGGLHASNVDSANIVINGGELKSVYGGGVASGFFDNPTAEETTHNYNGPAETSTTKVENASIIINGGKLTKYIYGGGMGYNYTGNTSITINGGDQSTVILTAGGANGYTGDSIVKINDGNVGIVQGVNRGSVDSADITISGGNVDTIYAGGETSDSTVNGTIADASITVEGGNVESISAGTNGGQNTSAGDVTVITYNEKFVTNIDESEYGNQAILKTVTLTFAAEGEKESIQVPVDFAFTKEDVEELRKELEAVLGGTGYALDNFYSDEECTKVYDMTTKFTEDVTVYINFVQLREEETPSVENPNTSDINLYGTIIAILLATAGLGYTIKKRRFN